VKIACLGGGPGGLAFAILAKKLEPARSVEVWDRNPPGATYGFGVVLSDDALAAIRRADEPIHDAIVAERAHWSEIDVHVRGRVHTSGGHGFSALSRKRLVTIMQERARDLGVTLHHSASAPLPETLGDYNLVVAADGAQSTVRELYPAAFRPTVELGACKFIWLATDRVFDAFKFFIHETEFGLVQVHAYPYDEHESTFIPELHESVWRRAGFAAFADAAQQPGESDFDSIEILRGLLSELLDGHSLLANNSKWMSFPTIKVEQWHAGNVVLLGDAAHTAHFTIGSATKLAFEDAVALAEAIGAHEAIEPALQAYEDERRPLVQSTQRAAAASREWFERIPQYLGQADEQFVFNLLTRSRRITYDNLRLRDEAFTTRVDEWFADEVVRQGSADRRPALRPPMFMPFKLRELELENRIVVSPMDMYCAVNGDIGDFHLVHLGSKALGGAGLVMSEMLCVSPEGRITPGCAGLWSDAQASAWARIVDFVHQRSSARVGAQLGHSGRKGSTKLLWEGVDEPLDDGNWEILAPSPLPYLPVSQVPRELTRSDLDVVLAQYVRSAELAESAGFDLLELHMAHGYLLSSFLTPVSNVRADDYGGTLEGRARFPLEVFDAVRAAWPADKPISVRISATDWVPGGFDGEQAVAFARMLQDHGCDVVDVSTGQTTPDARPAYGRSYQTPFSDRIRNELGMPTITVGAISSYDDVNSIILAGRADLCALARPHLYDPAWTLHAAADQGYAGEGVRWPIEYASGARRPQTGRQDLGAEPSPFEAEHTEVRRIRWSPAQV
jgi:anthraniloyl-CoA monooxygenase